ncbi:MAG: methylated-DNA--[protein]-cysteine S-methyltransferase [Chitinophagales bacterium]
MKKTQQIIYYNSPLGYLKMQMTEKGLTSLQIIDAEVAPKETNIFEMPSYAQEIVSQLEAYFAGNRQNFDIKLDLQGTAFQLKVWEKLLQIPYGKTTTYGKIAQDLNMPKAARAVGNACGKNKIWLIVPCHRVVGSTGKLTGYAGGLHRKKHLLNGEKKHKNETLF